MVEHTVQTHSHLGIGVQKKRERRKGREVREGVCSRSSHFLGEEEILFFCEITKYEPITRPFTSTLTLSTPWMQAHLGLSCANSVAIHPFVCRRRSDLCKCLQMDRQTDDGL